MLGLLCALQTTFQMLPTYAQIAGMVERGLGRIPGVGDVVIELDVDEADCERTLTFTTQHCAPTEPADHRLHLRTSDAAYGAMRVWVDSAEDFDLYRPFVQNIANMLATEIENRERARALDQMQAALRAERELLQREVSHKDRFLAMLGHELRNPLAAITTAVSLLASSDNDAAVNERVHDIIARQSGHMTRMVDDLLDVSRIARGKVQLDKRPLDLAELARKAAADISDRVQAAGLEFRVDIADTALPITGDATRLTQVIDNLIDNAIKFTEAPGRITLQAHRDTATDRAAVAVHDTGVGVDEHLIETLFLPFWQAPTPTDRPSQGLGLGLALVHGLVEGHGGTVDVTSEAGGASFRVYLPLDQDARATAQQRHKPLAMPTRRFMVVDDNRDYADAMAELLRLGGHQVEVAYDGPSAVALANDTHPDAILCDIGLGGPMSGHDVAAALTASTDHPPLLIALTGYGSEHTRQRALASGFDHFLTKPAKLHDVLDLVERHLADDG